MLPVIRVQSDKYRTGIITIVPVRTATVNLEKYRKILKRLVICQLSSLCKCYKLEKVNFLTYNDNNNNSVLNQSCKSQAFFK